MSEVRQARLLNARLTKAEAPGWRRILDAAYTVLLLALIVGAPTWLALRGGIESEAGLLWLFGTMPLPALVFAMTIPLAILASMAAPSLGPILGKPFDLHILSAAPLNRRATYGVRLRKTGTVLALLIAALVVLLWTLTGTSAVGLALGLLSAIAAAAAVVAVWLAGQGLPPVAARLVSVAASCILLFVMLTTPPDQLLRTFIFGPLGSAAVSVAIISVAVWTVWRILPLIRSHQVLSQAYLWQRLVNSAGIGDFTTARSELSVNTKIGRTWPLPTRTRWWGTVAWLGLLSLARSPWRILWIVAVNFAAVVLFATAPPLLMGPERIAMPVWAGGAAAVAQYLAFSCFGDRVRFAALTVLPPRLFGGSTWRLVAAHLIVPLVCNVLVTSAAALITRNFPVLVWSLWLLPIHCLTLVYTALKREPPLILTIPIASPMGDTSGFHQLLWQFDFLAIIALAGILIYALTPASLPATLITIAVFALYLIAGIRRRLRRN